MDFIVELPPSSPAGSADLYNSILVVVDRLTKMALFIPTVTTLKASELARLYVLHIFSKHGVPSDVVTDRGSTYTATFTKSLGELLKMKLNFSTVFHPESDGQTKRMNQTLEVYLRMYSQGQQKPSSLVGPNRKIFRKI
jgi:hypothetical protein